MPAVTTCASAHLESRVALHETGEGGIEGGGEGI